MTISSLQRFGGGYRIRTCGAFQPTCFRDKHHKPLGQSSVFCDAKITIFGEIINRIALYLVSDIQTAPREAKP